MKEKLLRLLAGAATLAIIMPNLEINYRNAKARDLPPLVFAPLVFVTSFSIISFTYFFVYKALSALFDTKKEDIQDFLGNLGLKELYALLIILNFESSLEIDSQAIQTKERLTFQVRNAVRTGRWDFKNIQVLDIADEKRLASVIHSLENDNKPMSFLICGLLLEGRLQNYVEPKEGKDLEEYYLKRIHDAITFYDKAASDEFLKPVTDRLLWELKAKAKHSSIQDRLASFDIPAPQNAKRFLMERQPVHLSSYFFNQPKVSDDLPDFCQLSQEHLDKLNSLLVTSSAHKRL